MFELLASLLVVTCLGIAQADHHLIAAGCDTNKTCFQFADCSVTTSPSTPNLATIYTTGDNTVEFQLQYNNIDAGWIAIGLSTTASMPNTNVFMCVRPDANVVVQERFASQRARPPIVTSLLTTESTANEGSLFNCTFTSPVTRTPMLNDISGYYVLLAWGQYSSNNIQIHAIPTGRCFTGSRMTITDASGVTITTQSTAATVQTTTLPTDEPSRCTGGSTCIAFAGCTITTSPSTPNLASFYTTANDTVEFQLQYDNINAGWIAIGLSTTQSMPDTYVFMCVRPDTSSVNVQERFASQRALPPLETSLLTTESTANEGSLFNCTFTSPVTRTPMLNNIDGYWVLLAWGQYNNNNIQQHANPAGRCVTASRMTITSAGVPTTTSSGATTDVTTQSPTPSVQPTTSVSPPPTGDFLITLLRLIIALILQTICFIFNQLCSGIVF